jgi:uncharacterized protein
MEDEHGHRCELRYIRDKEGREVDFAILVDGTLQELIEVKTSDGSISASLRYYAQRLKPPKVMKIVANWDRPFDKNGIHVTNAMDYFAFGASWQRNERQKNSLTEY